MDVRGRPICLITSMITDRIERYEVLLQINRNYNKIRYILGFFLIKTQEIPRVVFASSEKKPFKRACDGAYCPITGMKRTVLLHCPISTEIRTLDSQSDLRILLWL